MLSSLIDFSTWIVENFILRISVSVYNVISKVAGDAVIELDKQIREHVSFIIWLWVA